jgi:hypothetical protein
MAGIGEVSPPPLGAQVERSLALGTLPGPGKKPAALTPRIAKLALLSACAAPEALAAPASKGSGKPRCAGGGR